MTSSPLLTQLIMEQNKAFKKVMSWKWKTHYSQKCNFTFECSACNQDLCKGINSSLDGITVEFGNGLNQTWMALIYIMVIITTR
jgi:hypothetical protein